jgi:flagellar FliJ protein
MKRFVWRLQRVLDIKIKEEQFKKAQLAKLTDMLALRKTELLIEKRKLKEIIDGLGSQNPLQRLSGQEFFLKTSASSDRRIKELEIRVKELEVEQKEKIKELIALKMFREGLEKMREDSKREFISKQEKLEQKELEEQATIGFVRKMALETKN